MFYFSLIKTFQKFYESTAEKYKSSIHEFENEFENEFLNEFKNEFKNEFENEFKNEFENEFENELNDFLSISMHNKIANLFISESMMSYWQTCMRICYTEKL